eukprot:TRINITY_DN970_c0_g1_i1.p1 TRINITY_DN970_c0_g1~~TRINITY_DN970_c0_g1_i1.p1  ORF type:complete len:406 (-),score=103.04 TRINITY_DN970_c0_g1_i1:81-1298(-)
MSVNEGALESEIRARVIDRKANACPMVVRLAWHASGTFDKKDGSGGSGTASMRFSPECDDGANAGLGIIRDMLLPVKKAHPEISYGDIWTFAGCKAVEFMGGPAIKHRFGRKDCTDGSACPANGRLPDAAQGAQHLRDVFYRMGFNDQEIVALSGAHTLGRCHLSRSGFDGPWTRNPLKFDNHFFTNLMNLKWKKREWDGPEQFEDELTGDLMMLPTDMALKTDPEFRKYAEAYAKDEQLFFKEFAAAFAKLLALGTDCDPTKRVRVKRTDAEKAGLDFREHAMHGSVDAMKKARAKGADIQEQESTSGRTALHKAAFWGHVDASTYLLNDCKINLNVVDFNGDTALHDAARFGHSKVVQLLIDAGIDVGVKNAAGQTAQDVALAYDKPEIAAQIAKGPSSRSNL